MLRWFRTRAVLPCALVLVAAIALAGGGVARMSAPQAVAAGDCTTSDTIDSEEQAFLTLINNYRAQNGKGALTISYQLSKAAQWKSNDLGVNAYFAHDDLTRTWVQRIRDCGYGYNTYIGENIAAGISSAQSAFNLWQGSPGHNANMLGSNYTAIGIGRANVPGSPYGWYWTTEFGGAIDPWPGGSATATRTATATATRTATATATRTPTRTATATATRTNTPVPPTSTPVPATSTSTPTAPDTIAPSAAITAPGAGATVAGTLAFGATASDGVGVAKVRFWVDGTYLGYDMSAPYGKTWATAAFTNGKKTLKIQALDNAGNSTVKTMVVTVINPDTTPPVLSIAAPSSGATVSGIVALVATASDTQGLQKVRFWMDSIYLGYVSDAPWTLSWDSSTRVNGTHTLRVQAVDWANNTTTVAIPIVVSN